jgi:hypothetical protein
MIRLFDILEDYLIQILFTYERLDRRSNSSRDAWRIDRPLLETGLRQIRIRFVVHTSGRPDRARRTISSLTTRGYGSRASIHRSDSKRVASHSITTQLFVETVCLLEKTAIESFNRVENASVSNNNFSSFGRKINKRFELCPNRMIKMTQQTLIVRWMLMILVKVLLIETNRYSKFCSTGILYIFIKSD